MEQFWLTATQLTVVSQSSTEVWPLLIVAAVGIVLIAIIALVAKHRQTERQQQQLHDLEGLEYDDSSIVPYVRIRIYAFWKAAF
jgi:membrane protein YdbS with pleckstrin-like domain